MDVRADASGDGVEARRLTEVTELEPEAKTVNGTKLEILLPALLPLVGPGAMTPTKNVPGVRNDAGMLACTSLALTKFETKFTLVLLELFQVTVEPATNPAPFIVKRTSWLAGAVAPLGVMEVIEELTVGDAPR